MEEIQKHQCVLMTLLREFDRVCKTLDISYTLFAGTMLGAVRHQGFIPWDDDVDIIMLREDYERFLAQAESVLDTEKFYLQKEFSEHWPMFFSKLRLNNTTCLEKYHPNDPETHQGIYLDIFPCDNGANTSVGRKIQFFASKVVIAKSLDARGYETDSNLKKLFIGFCRPLPMKPFLALAKAKKKNSKLVHSFFAGASKYKKNIYPRHFFEERIQVYFEQEQYPVSKYYDEILHLLYGDYSQIPQAELREIKKHAILIDTENSYEKYKYYREGMEFESYTRSIR